VLTSNGSAWTSATPAAAGGTVTSVATGTGLTGGTITTSGTISLVTTAGAVGTYAFAGNATTAITAGSSYAGSALLYAGLATNGAATTTTTSAGSLSGTWRAMGSANPGWPCPSGPYTTLFLRIA